MKGWLLVIRQNKSVRRRVGRQKDGQIYSLNKLRGRQIKGEHEERWFLENVGYE